MFLSHVAENFTTEDSSTGRISHGDLYMYIYPWICRDKNHISQNISNRTKYQATILILEDNYPAPPMQYVTAKLFSHRRDSK